MAEGADVDRGDDGVSPGYAFIVIVALAAVRPAPSMRVYG